MSFCLRPNVCKKCGKPLTIFEGWTCLECEMAEQEPCDDAISREAVNTLVDELARAISDERCHIPQRGRDTGHIMHDILDLPSVTVRQTNCENCSKCEDAFMRGHDVGLENGYRQGDRDARYESVTQKSGKWTNVNDMLPREREDVLVTCFVHENWQTKIGYWNGKAWVVNAYDILFIDRLEVTAWMPLPKPFEPQESQKVNCKSTKCENCINHNYCDFEPQESEVNNADDSK